MNCVHDVIIMAMKNNTSLTKLNMYANQISEEHIQLIIKALQHNNTLKHLVFPITSVSSETINLLVEAVNMKRKSCGCNETLEITHND